MLSIVRDKSPRYAAMRQRLERSRADVVAAGVLPNPRVSYGRYDLISRNNTMYEGNVQQEVTLEVPLLIAGQRGARVAAAEKQVEATEAGIESEFADLIQQVWRLFLEMLVEQRRISVLEQSNADMQHLSAVVEGRAQAGTASQYDVLRATIETKGLQSRLETVRNDLASTVGELGAMLGLPDWKPIPTGDLSPLGIPADAKKLWKEAEQANPDLESARRNELAADANLERARRERWPVPSVLVGSAFTDKPYGNTTFAGFSVELPLFDRGQGGMAKAAAEKQSAILDRQYATARTRGALERAVDQLKLRRESRVQFEQSVMAKLPALKAMGEASYRLGKGTLLELLDASRSRTDTQLTYVELVQAETEAELDVLRTSGLLLKTIDVKAP
ncbi:TolC family protein [Methyloterricola oryzae]|uniref:TolC family protein n=1 Tax=Methyloterricola oryzae TaxID=1495050 RepID=UPI002E11EE5C